MWPVRSSDTTSSVAVGSNSFVIIDTNSFAKNGRKISVGDCALFEPPCKSLPFVGRIRKLKLGKENNISLCVNWLYRPADVKLKEGALLDAAPNEVFYSFHKDEIPAASLLHPCKVTFLRKGVELPSGIASFVCRQVYDIKTERLWWLTDKDYINGLQEEVDQLLDKTLIDMHGGLQTGGRSPKPLNGPNRSLQLKRSLSSLDNVQRSSWSISSHAKNKKREDGVHTSASVKRERLSKVDDGNSAQNRPEHILKTEIAKITDKYGLIHIGSVEKLIQLMRPESTGKKLNLSCRTMLVDVISGTDRFECLSRFVHLRGLLVLDEWLQEIHKGKIGDDKSVEEFLFSLLRSLEKLPVNLQALQSCNIGKSVNHLRSHKNCEIQKKARSLVSTWKRRVEAEMNIIETKSSTSQGGTWPNKSMISEVSRIGGTRRGSSMVSPKSSKSSALKAPPPKKSSVEAITTSPTSPASTKLSSLSTNKEERSCRSSQSPNNSQSCSSDHGKTGASSESKISSSVSLSKTSGDALHGTAIPGVQREVGKIGCLSRDLASEKGSTRLLVNGNIPRLIVRLPNPNRSPTQTSSLESPEDSSTISVKGSLLPSTKQDKKMNGKFDSLQENNVPNSNTSTDDDLSGEKGLNVRDEEHGKKDSSFGSGSSSGVTPKAGKLCEPSYSSINALVESCARFSEAGDDVGINLLASVAAGETLRSDVSPAFSSDCNSPEPEDSCSVSAAKLRQVAHDGDHSEDNTSVANSPVIVEQIGSVGGDNNNSRCVIMADEVKPAESIEDATHIEPNSTSLLEEDKCPDDKLISNTLGPLDGVARSVKSETTQINEHPDFCSSSDMDDDEKEVVHNRLTGQLGATTSCGDADLAPKSKETDDNKSHLHMDSGTSFSELAYEDMEKDDKSSVVALQEVSTCGKASNVTEANCAEDRTVKWDFDLNEVLPNDDGIECEVEKAAVHAPNQLPSYNITPAAAKGPLYPSETPPRGKPEFGWKGSAATSVFCTTEPRKVDAPDPDNRTSKLARTVFDFDLNVGLDDAGQHNATSGLDLDLNACVVSPEAAQLSVSTSSRPSMSAQPGKPNFSRDFERNGMQFVSGVPDVRMNNLDIRNFSSWSPPNNTYPAITTPSQKMLSPMSSSMSLNPETFRGPVFSSSPATVFPSTVPYQYTAFPFDTNFSLPSIPNTLSSVSNAYVDSSSTNGGPFCFPTIPPMGPNGVVSMPYYMSLPPGGSSNVGVDGRKWGTQGLDLNPGLGNDKLPTGLRQLPLGGDEQLRMFQHIVGGGGVVSKRKEPDGGWDGDNRISYKYPHRQ